MLKAKPKDTGNPILKTIAAGFTEPTTFIRSPSEAIRKVEARRERIRSGDMRELRKVNREILTKAVVGVGTSALGASGKGLKLVKTAVPKLLPTTPKGIIVGVTGAGVLTTSPTVRNIVGGFVRDPVGLGAEGGIILEKAIEGKTDIPFKEALLTGGVLGAGVAAAVGGKKLADKIFDGKKDITPSSVPSSIALPSSSIPTALEPISSAPVIASPPKPETSSSSQVPVVNVKVTNKPQINIANAQSI